MHHNISSSEARHVHYWTADMQLPAMMSGALAKPILQHRIITNFHAEAEGKTSLHIIDQLLDTIKEHT